MPPEQYNPYAPPQADYAPPTGASVDPDAAGTFHAMSVRKLWLMSVLTLGIYDLWFWWRQWRHVRDHHEVDLSVFWRTVFSPFMYFEFNSRVKAAVDEHQLPHPTLLGAAPDLYLATNIAGRVLGRIETDSLALMLASILIIPLSSACVASTQAAINAVLARDGYAGPVNDKITAGSVVGGILGGLMWCLIIIGLFA